MHEAASGRLARFKRADIQDELPCLQVVLAADALDSRSVVQAS